MTGLRDFALTYLVNCLWQVPLFSAGAWVLDRLLRRAARLRHHAWVASLCLAILMPAAPSWDWLDRYLSLPARPGTGAIHLRILVDSGRTPGHPGGQIAWLALLIYLCLCAGFAVRFWLSLRSTAALLRRSEPAQLSPLAREAWALCRARFALRNVRLLTTTQLAAPAACGLLRPAILLPPRLLAEGCSQDLLAALAHESAHVQRLDFAWNLLYECMALPIAWHPAAWLLRSGVARTRELLCDQIAVDTMRGITLPHCFSPFSSRSYAHALLRCSLAAAQAPNATATVSILDGDILETRVMAITRPSAPLRPYTKRLLLAATAIVLATAGSVTTTYAFSLQSEPPVGSASGHVYTVGNGVSSPKLLSSVDPSFPKGVHVSKTFAGVSVIGIVVDQRGMPLDLHVIRSLTPAFDAEAMKAIRQYRFRPAMKNRQPVAVSITIEVKFQRF